MAEQGRKLEPSKQREIRRLAEVNQSRTEIARMANVSRPTVYKYAGKKNQQ